MIGELVRHKGNHRANDANCVRGEVGIVLATDLPFTLTSHDLGGPLDTPTDDGIEVMTKEGDILLSHCEDWEVVK
jgi:hypothetical protein